MRSIPCHPLHHGAESSVRGERYVERCFAWGLNGEAREEKSYAPLLPTSRGWNFTEYDTASQADGRRRCDSQRSAMASPEATAASAKAAHAEWGACLRRLRLKSKPGLTAFAPGSVADFVLLSPATGPGWGGGAREAQLRVSYLSSYEGMGQALVRCSRGCACEASRVIDAHRAAGMRQRQVSVWSTTVFDVEMRGRRCGLRVEVMNTTSSGGFKFKIDELVLRWKSAERSGTACIEKELVRRRPR